MTEAEKRTHRCCFTGHGPAKLKTDEQEIKQWLEEQIDTAIQQGYTTFITGMAMGVDIWSGLIVAEKKKSNPSLHLIAAVPYPGFDRRWKAGWQKQYDDLLKSADLVKTICPAFHNDAFALRNRWMIDHSARIIGWYSGEPGGAADMLRWAEESGLSVVSVTESEKAVNL